MKMELHRINYNRCEAQNLTEQSTRVPKHTVDVSEFFLDQNRSNKFDKLKSHIEKLKYTKSSRVFLGLKFLIQPTLSMGMLQ